MGWGSGVGTGCGSGVGTGCGMGVGTGWGIGSGTGFGLGSGVGRVGGVSIIILLVVKNSDICISIKATNYYGFIVSIEIVKSTIKIVF